MSLWILLLILVTPDGSLKTKVAFSDDYKTNTKEHCLLAGVNIVAEVKQKIPEAIVSFECMNIPFDRIEKALPPKA